MCSSDLPGDAACVSTTYSGLPGDVKAGDTILIDDGRVALEVTDVDGPRVVTRVVEGGRVSDNKGLNLPGVAVSVPAMSEKDIDDLRWALRAGADLIALVYRGSVLEQGTHEALMAIPGGGYAKLVAAQLKNAGGR